MRSWSIESESALIEIHNGTVLDVFMPPYSRLELQTMDGISFGMQESFFYS